MTASYDAADVLRIDGQVGNAPVVIVLRQRLEAFLDGVLVAPAERGVDQIAGIRVSWRYRQSIAVLGDSAQRVDVGDVELGINAVAEQVHRQIDDVDVAGALAVAEQRSLDAIGAGHHTELSGRHTATAVVVRMQADDHRIAIANRATEPFDHVAVHVGRVALDRRRQVQDHRLLGRWLDDIHHRFADSNGELRLRQREALRRVLVSDRGVTHRLLELATQLGCIDSDVDDSVHVEPEHHVRAATDWWSCRSARSLVAHLAGTRMFARSTRGGTARAPGSRRRRESDPLRSTDGRSRSRAGSPTGSRPRSP